jgi:hypothetical protein
MDDVGKIRMMGKEKSDEERRARQGHVIYPGWRDRMAHVGCDRISEHRILGPLSGSRPSKPAIV